MGEKIDQILERFYKKEIDLLEVRKELLILFSVSGSFLDELIEKHKANKKLALNNCKKMKDTDQYPWYDATFNNELLFVHDLEDLKCRIGL